MCYDKIKPMSPAFDFIMVVSDEEDAFCGYHLFAEKINRKLKAGYQLHGQPVAIHKALCQAMIKPIAPGQEASVAKGDTTVFYPRAVQA